MKGEVFTLHEPILALPKGSLEQVSQRSIKHLKLSLQITWSVAMEPAVLGLKTTVGSQKVSVQELHKQKTIPSSASLGEAI